LGAVYINVEEQILIQKCKIGDEGAFREVFEHYYSPIYYFCLSYVRSRNEAEDLTQEVFIKAFKSIKSFGKGSFRAWLFKIARNHLIDEHRKHIRSITVSIDDVAEPAIEHTPESEIVARSDMVELLKVIDGLAPEYREVMYLRFFQGLRYEEISEALGIPVGTVKTYIHRGRKEMLKRINIETKQ